MIVHNLNTLLSSPDQKINYIIEPWLQSSNLILLFAPRGLGKTHFCISLAYAIAAGIPFLKWDNVSKRKVAYLDGEMGAGQLQYRLKKINVHPDKIKGEDFSLLSYNKSTGLFPNLSDPINQEEVYEQIKDASVIFIDNLLSCAGRLENRDDEFKLWERLQSWFVFLREQKKTVFLVHHTGKSGDQSGTMQKENIMDCVIKLSKAYSESHNGCCFEFHVTKARNFKDSDTPPFIAKLFSEENQTPYWTWVDLEVSQANFIASKLRLGWTDMDISSYLNISRGQVKTLKHKYGNPETNIQDTESKIVKIPSRENDYESLF